MSGTTANTHKKNQAEPSLGAPALARDLIELRLLMPWADNLAGPSDQLRKLMMNLKSASDDRIRIQIKQTHANATHAFKTGKIDLYFGPLHSLENAPKAALYFSGLPHGGGLNAADLESWTTMTGAGLLFEELGARMGIKPLLAGHMGVQPGLWSKTPINCMADLHGKKVALTGTPKEIISAYGAHPANVPLSSLGSALENGTIDVAECGGYHIAMSLKLHDSATHVAKGVFNPSGTALTLAIAGPLWKSFSKSDQAIFSACASQSYRMALTENRALETPLGVALNRHNQVRLHTLSNDKKKTWERISDAFLANISNTDDLSKRIDASYNAFQKLAV